MEVNGAVAFLQKWGGFPPRPGVAWLCQSSVFTAVYGKLGCQQNNTSLGRSETVLWQGAV